MNKICIVCSGSFAIRKDKNQSLCSRSCAAKKQHIDEKNEFIKKWLCGEVSGGRGDMSGHGAVSKHIRNYLFDKNNSKCSICGWSEINKFTNTIPLEIDHIDGNPMNHSPANLQLLCPNCHSLTPGHSTKKGRGRRYYRDKYHKG